MRETRQPIPVLCLTAFLLLTGISALTGLDPETPLKEYIYDFWSSKQGLPQDTVYAILQDQQGYLWIGTDGGIVRYNGRRFRVFSTSNTPALKSNSITALMETSDGRIWIGTFGGGITVFSNGAFTRPSLSGPLPGESIWTLCETADKTVWVGTAGGGLAGISGNRVTVISTENGLSDNRIMDIAEDSYGNLWVGTENGLNRLREGRVLQIFSSKDLPGSFVFSILEDHEKKLWFGTTMGLCRMEGEKFIPYTVHDGLSNNFIRKLHEDRDHNIWIATDNGLNRISDGDIQSFGDLPDTSLLAFEEDHEGNLWIGTTGRGIIQMHNRHIYALPQNEALLPFQIRGVMEDSKKTLWIATNGGGLFQKTEKGFTRFGKKEGLTVPFVHSLTEDRRGNIWIGTQSGLFMLSGRRITPVNDEESFHSYPIRTLLEDREGTVWIGTYGNGLWFYQNKTLKKFSSPDKNPGKFILSIAADSRNSLWIGTPRGLFVMNREKVSPVFSDTGIWNCPVNDIYIDREDTVWIATQGSGLFIVKDRLTAQYHTGNGLANDTLYRIIEDKKRYLWISTNRGIIRVSGSRLLRLLGGKVSHVPCQTFLENDGMTSAVCTGGYQPSGWMRANGEIVFPTTQGISVVAPDQLKLNRTPPPVVLEEILVDNRPRINHQPLTLPSGTGKIEIFYSVLSFTVPQKVKIRYRLFGHQAHWVESPPGDKITFINLKPGKYRFKIAACNNDSIWNLKGDSVSFRIRPPFYLTGWFILVMAVFGTLVIFFTYRWFTSLPQKRKERDRKYKESLLTPAMAQAYLRKLHRIMDTEKPYLNENLTLGELARRIGIPDKQLSQIINQHRNENFKNFINRHRIEEAKKKILDPREKDFVLLKIAYDVGFNSKSVFNAAFKKFTKMSPSQYRKKHNPPKYDQ